VKKGDKFEERKLIVLSSQMKQALIKSLGITSGLWQS